MQENQVEIESFFDKKTGNSFGGSRDEQTISLLNFSNKLASLELDGDCTKEEVEANYYCLVYTLHDYGVSVTFVNVAVGPSNILYILKPTSKKQIKFIGKLKSDIALSLAAIQVCVIAPMPNGDDVVGIVIPRAKPRRVTVN